MARAAPSIRSPSDDAVPQWSSSPSTRALALRRAERCSTNRRATRVPGDEGPGLRSVRVQLKAPSRCTSSVRRQSSIVSSSNGTGFWIPALETTASSDRTLGGRTTFARRTGGASPRPVDPVTSRRRRPRTRSCSPSSLPKRRGSSCRIRRAPRRVDVLGEPWARARLQCVVDTDRANVDPQRLAATEERHDHAERDEPGRADQGRAS